ncbi:MAG: DUF1315 family protein [Halomonadaceae bacterium]|nr:MAG: DUF1315 family protein [Halomonadaceae bacterium]
MTYEELVQKLNPEVYRSLKRAVELGKWPDGRALTREQRDICLEAVIFYETKHEVAPEERTGYIDRSRKKGGSKDGSDPIRILN